MGDIKSNRELYNRYLAMAPKLLADISKLLTLCRHSGIPVPKGIRHIFEFTWAELITDSMVPTGSNIPGMEVSSGAPLVVQVKSTPVLSQRKLPQLLSPVPTGPVITKAAWNSVTPTHLAPAGQEMLRRFQRQSVHLLTELLALKTRAMAKAASGKVPRCPLPASSQMGTGQASPTGT